jgi:hypothetical protein
MTVKEFKTRFGNLAWNSIMQQIKSAKFKKEEEDV